MNQQLEAVSPNYEDYDGLEVSKISKWVKLSQFVEVNKLAIIVLAALFIYCKLSGWLAALTIVCITLLGFSERLKSAINHATTKKRRKEKPIEP